MEAGTSFCFQEVYMMNRSCWLVMTLEWEEKKTSVQFFTCICGWIICTSISHVNLKNSLPSVQVAFRKADDEYSHCKLLSKSTIWTSIQLCASKKGKRHLNWMHFSKSTQFICFSCLFFFLPSICLFRIGQHPNPPTHSFICMLLCKQQKAFFPWIGEKKTIFFNGYNYSYLPL